MSISSILSGLITKENKLTSNKVANLAYNETAYTTDDANGVEVYDPANNQNIPSANAAILGINNTVLNHGFRNQASTVPRMVINHFFGRVSYNLNKVNDIMSSLLNGISNSLGASEGIATLNADAEVPKVQLPKCTIISEDTTLSDTFDTKYLITTADVTVTLPSLSSARAGTRYDFSSLYDFDVTYTSGGSSATDSILANKSAQYVYDGSEWFLSTNQTGDDGQPIGTVLKYPSDNIPNNYCICDGRTLSRTVYHNLFQIIGTTFGEGDEYTTFNVPNIPPDDNLMPNVKVNYIIKLTNFKAEFNYGVLDDTIITSGNAWSIEKTITHAFDGVCNSAGSDATKIITFPNYHGTVMPRKFTVTYGYGNTYGDVTTTMPTHPVLVFKNADGVTLGNAQYDDCDSLGHFAGARFNDGDIVSYEIVGNKALSMNTDIRQKTSSMTVKSDGLVKRLYSAILNNISISAGTIGTRAYQHSVITDLPMSKLKGASVIVTYMGASSEYWAYPFLNTTGSGYIELLVNLYRVMSSSTTAYANVALWLEYYL